MTFARPSRALLFAAALLTGISPVLTTSALAQARDRIVAPIVDAEAVTLVGNTHPMARAEFDRGVLADETRLERMVLVLKPDARRQKALDALVEAQQEPQSPHYHQWLAAEEFGARFGASAGDLATLTAWLEGHGFSVEPAEAGRSLLVFSGTAGQVAEAFHTEMHGYDVDGVRHIANSEDPQIPKALAPVVAGVLSLHDFRRASSSHVLREAGKSSSKPENTEGGSYYLLPADYGTIYDLNPLYAAGKNGTGVSIGIVGRSNITLSDVSTFRSYSALPANQPTVILEGANPGLVSGDVDESTLDVEWAGGVAPGAAVKFVVGASTATTDGVDLSAQYIVNHKTAQVMSTSYGSCEAAMGATELAFYNSLWQQAASEGISAFVSSGDSGAAGCNGGSSSNASTRGVNGLCSSPYSTCVGGTELNEGQYGTSYWSSTNGAGGGSALSYIPEKVWNESASDGGAGLWASGGGISTTYAQPSWQAGVSGASSNGMRAVPDVALTAAAHDGYLICEYGNWYVIAGTSAASPSFAGIMSVVVQKAGAANAAEIGQGNANPTLYGLLTAGANPFHATPSGNNSVPGVNGFMASGAAYNLATGLGSVDANLLVNEWPVSGTGVKQGFTLKPSASSETITAGKTATFTVTVAATGGFTGSVSLSATAPAGVTVSFSPAAVSPGGSATATVTVANTVAAEKVNLTLTGSSSGLSSTAAVGLNLLAAPTLSVSTAATTLSVEQGKTATMSVDIVTGGTYSGAVTLSTLGLSSGVTASWSASSFPSNGSAKWVSTLTLTAASTAAISTSNLKIAATGDGLSSFTLIAVSVTK